jgi:hypothetical protein
MIFFSFRYRRKTCTKRIKLSGILRPVIELIFLDVSKGFNALRFCLNGSRTFILKIKALCFLVTSGIIHPATQPNLPKPLIFSSSAVKILKYRNIWGVWGEKNSRENLGPIDMKLEKNERIPLE